MTEPIKTYQLKLYKSNIVFHVNPAQNRVRVQYTNDLGKNEHTLYLYDFNEGEAYSDISCGSALPIELGRKIWKHFTKHGWTEVSL